MTDPDSRMHPCACGCGLLTSTTYVNGHNRCKNPWRSELYEIDESTGCWNWLHGKSRGGYAVQRVNGRLTRVARMYYEEKYGPIPDGMVVDHLCRNPGCVNPDHIEVVTLTENTRRGKAAKLSPFLVRFAAHLNECGKSKRAISRMFGVSHTTINYALSGKTWADVS